ncbi:hypothetical protein CMI37_15885 [Candidatus Pacearchaeota archaeon]|jgi:hypothetical protein|nr:hypothetical protein [Candidatus Pacearchaeota archaeon]|tara:strand:+ start:462 stop:650 length:189 start_codon:yes stop_codon:yes gene_type:complete
MTEYIYEQRNLNAWHEYQTLNGQVDFESFMARHYRVNEWIVSQMPKWAKNKFAQMDLVQAGD